MSKQAAQRFGLRPASPYSYPIPATTAKPARIAETPAPAHSAVAAKPKPIEGLAPELQQQLISNSNALRNAWQNQQADAVNEQIARLAALLPTVSPSLYPSTGRLAMESWYFRYQSMTWVWLLYLACVMPLLMSVIYKWDWARTAGMILFIIAFVAQSASIGVRWYVSGRWPNANMFEAVTAAAWIGIALALLVELIYRTRIFVLAANVTGFSAKEAFAGVGINSGSRLS